MTKVKSIRFTWTVIRTTFVILFADCTELTVTAGLETQLVIHLLDYILKLGLPSREVKLAYDNIIKTADLNVKLNDLQDSIDQQAKALLTIFSLVDSYQHTINYDKRIDNDDIIDYGIDAVKDESDAFW